MYFWRIIISFIFKSNACWENLHVRNHAPITGEYTVLGVITLIPPQTKVWEPCHFAKDNVNSSSITLQYHFHILIPLCRAARPHWLCYLDRQKVNRSTQKTEKLARALSGIQQGMLRNNPRYGTNSVNEANEVLGGMLNPHKCLLESGVKIQKTMEPHPARRKEKKRPGRRKSFWF